MRRSVSRPLRRLACWIAVQVAVLAGAASVAVAQALPPEHVIAGWSRPGAHPLIGKIWTARDGRITDGMALARGVLVGSPIADALGIKGPAFVLLGEVHDNPEHHLLRAALIDDITEPNAFGRNHHPAVVTEHIRVEQLPALQAFRSQAGNAGGAVSADDLFGALAWQKSGWPDAKMFRPLYEAILAARLPLFGGDVSRGQVRAVARGGLAVLPADEIQRLHLDAPFPPKLSNALGEELEKSHCGMLSGSAIAPMALAQRYRDAHLADTLLVAEASAGRAILIAGNGHVRADRGVPWYIRARRAGASIVAVMLIEVEEGQLDAAAYAVRAPDGRPAADAVVFTPRATRDDPCVAMRAGLSKKG